uniref:Uncharacterized protein n=1 Tax=Picea sitchensis TaxID=3332 RepID=A9NSB0_PICSI|nr:unknown [Picea sitchensis]
MASLTLLLLECKKRARPSFNFPLKRRKPTLTKHRIPSAMAAKSDIRQIQRLSWNGETITITLFGLLI